MKKLIKYFPLFLFSAFLMILFASNPVEANYDRNKNNVSVSVSYDKEKETVTIDVNVQYQRGISGSSSYYQWCSLDAQGQSSRCLSNNYFAGNSGFVLDQRNASETDNDPTVKTYSKTYAASELFFDSNATEYNIFIYVGYCAFRSGSDNKFVSCEVDRGHSLHPDSFTPTKLKNAITMEGLKTNSFATTGDLPDIENEDVRNFLQIVSDVIYGTVMPVIWIVLGLFLVVKGTITGVQIVKAADEPQVRQEKIGSLKWLVIGVAIAAAIATIVQVLTGYFSGVFGTYGK